MLLAYHAVRNSSLEDIHSSGEEITDARMKDLMIEVTDRLYSILRYHEQLPNVSEVEVLFTMLQVPSYWQQPKRVPMTMLDAMDL